MRWPTNHIFLMVPKAYLKSRMKKLIPAEITVAKVARRRVKVASRLGWQARCHMLRTSSHKRIYTELLMPASTLSNRAQLRIRLEHRQRNRWRIITISPRFWGRAQVPIDLPPLKHTNCKAQKQHQSKQANSHSEPVSQLVSLTLVARNTI